MWYYEVMEKKELPTSNADEIITISRAEYEKLKSEKAKLEAELTATEQKQAEIITSLTLQNQWLLEQLKLSKQKLFGRSSEQAEQMVMDQLSFTANEAEAYAFGIKSATPEQVQVKAHERRRNGSIEEVIPEGLPVEKVEHRLEDTHCPNCGAEMVIIGSEVHKSLKIEPPKFTVVEDVYYTYACKVCEKETDETVIVKTPKEPVVLPGSFASAESIAHIMVQKYVMHSPLYRLEKEFERQGLKLSRQAMSRWLLRASELWLEPVYEELHRQLLARQVLHADETTLQVLREPGRKSTGKSYMWLYRTSGDAGQQIVLYDYKPNRKPENAETFLEGFRGWLHADGYQGYHRLPEDIRVVGCWAHARRKFNEALQVLPEESRKDSQAAVGEHYCTELFGIEKQLAALSPEERYHERLKQEKPVLDAMLAWANDLYGKTAGKSALGKALYYLIEQWPYLIRYLEDGRLELSNNRAERSIKPFVMGRKNWLFANTPGGAKASSIIYSLIETARENGLDPYRYLLRVLQTAPKLSQSDENWATALVPAYARDECKVNG